MPDLPPKINLPRVRRYVPRPQYGRLHRLLREQVLDLADGLCTRCRKAFAEHVHHLRPDATSATHYQAVCPACHRAIHREGG